MCLQPLLLVPTAPAHLIDPGVCFCRHEQPRGAGAGGARLQDAVSTGLPHLAARAHAAVLEERRRGAAHLRVPSGLLGGLFYSHGASVPARGQPLRPLPERGEGQRLWKQLLSAFILGISTASFAPPEHFSSPSAAPQQKKNNNKKHTALDRVSELCKCEVLGTCWWCWGGGGETQGPRGLCQCNGISVLSVNKIGFF